MWFSGVFQPSLFEFWIPIFDDPPQFAAPSAASKLHRLWFSIIYIKKKLLSFSYKQFYSILEYKDIFFFFILALLGEAVIVGALKLMANRSLKRFLNNIGQFNYPLCSQFLFFFGFLKFSSLHFFLSKT